MKIIASQCLAVVKFSSRWLTSFSSVMPKTDCNAYLDAISALPYPDEFESLKFDCESEFMTSWTQLIPQDFAIRIHLVGTKVYMAVVNSQICSLYQNSPVLRQPKFTRTVQVAAKIKFQEMLTDSR